LRQRQTTLSARGVAVLVVTFETGPSARAYVEDTQLPWPLLMDGSRTLYRAYGMGRGRWWNVWGPATWRAYARLALHGRWARRSSGDVHQLGGDVLIDPAGAVRVHHVGSGPADRPSIESLLRVLHESGGRID
jgi:hypothetical protein